MACNKIEARKIRDDATAAGIMESFDAVAPLFSHLQIQWK